MENILFLLDLKIFFKIIIKVLKREGVNSEYYFEKRMIEEVGSRK